MISHLCIWISLCKKLQKLLLWWEQWEVKLNTRGCNEKAWECSATNQKVLMMIIAWVEIPDGLLLVNCAWTVEYLHFLCCSMICTISNYWCLIEHVYFWSLTQVIFRFHTTLVRSQMITNQQGDVWTLVHSIQWAVWEIQLFSNSRLRWREKR